MLNKITVLIWIENKKKYNNFFAVWPMSKSDEALCFLIVQILETWVLLNSFLLCIWQRNP